MLLFQPMPLQKCPLPFSSADWIFELKYDGFRAPVVGLTRIIREEWDDGEFLV